MIPADGSAARRIGHGGLGRILELAVAPDRSMAAVACADGRLLTVVLEGEPVTTEIARSANAEVAGLAFSPDSALLAWSQPWRPERGAAQIRLARLAAGTVTDVTRPGSTTPRRRSPWPASTWRSCRIAPSIRSTTRTAGISGSCPGSGRT